MGKNQSASGLTNFIHYDSNGNITFVSGSTTLMSISSSGAITTTGVISGSNALTASYANNADLLDGLNSTAFATTGAYSDTSGSLYSTSASLSAASGSFNSRVTALETYDASLTAKTASFATTGSNNFRAPQYVSDTTVPTGFANTTGSIYTDGGLQVTKDSYFSGSMFIKGDLTVYGTQSIAYITSSQLNIATNLITVNTATPSVRFGGLAVYDSGSTGTGMTGSLLWDSQNNRWLYSNPSGSSYDGGMLISGPRNTSGLGNEQGTTACMLLAGQGGDHLTSSMIYHSSTVTCIPNTLAGSVACFSGHICGNGAIFSNNVTAGTFISNGTSLSSGANITLINNSGASVSRFYSFGADSATLGGFKFIGIHSDQGAPTTFLDIASTGVATFACSVGATGAFTSTGTTTNTLGFVTTNTSANKTHRAYTDSSCNYIIYDATLDSNRLIISSDGNVGIGNASVGSKLYTYLTVDGTHYRGRTIDGCNNPYFDIKTSGGTVFIDANGSVCGQIAIKTGDIERLRITKDGISCFGYQVCAPRLTLNSSNTGTLDIGTISTGGIANQIIGGQYAGYAYTGRLSFKVGTWGAGSDYGPTEQMFMEVQGADTKRISMGIATNGGYVGIGTSSPVHILDINDCTGRGMRLNSGYDQGDLLMITNKLDSARFTINNNVPLAAFRICKGGGQASSASYSLIGGHMYISFNLRYAGGYDTSQSIIYPFLIASAGQGGPNLFLGTPNCITGFDNTASTTSFGISMCGISDTQATLLVCAKNSGFTIEGSTSITISIVASRTAILSNELMNMYKL